MELKNNSMIFDGVIFCIDLRHNSKVFFFNSKKKSTLKRANIYMQNIIVLTENQSRVRDLQSRGVGYNTGKVT